jgi:hypothetical protein
MFDYAVIDSSELRRMTADGTVVTVGPGGRFIEKLHDDTDIPAMLVTPVTDAVKVVDGDRLIEDLDRSLLWSLRGIAVDYSVAESLPDGVFTLSELIHEVEAAGHAWHTTLL